MEFDVVVVGAGPTGSNTARLLAIAGWKVLLLEEHSQVGIPVQCAGLVTPRTFDHTPFPIGDLWQNDLTGARIHAPDGSFVEFDAKRPHAQAMDRARFDQRMAEFAVAAGATLWTGAKAVAAERDPLGITVRVQVAAAKGLGAGVGGPASSWSSPPPPPGEHAVRARLLVGADGIRSMVARWFDFPPVSEIVSCYEAELSGCSIAPSGAPGARGPAGAAASPTGAAVSPASPTASPAAPSPAAPTIIPMFAGSAQAPGFFSWIIPVGSDPDGKARARAGLAVAPGMNEQSAKAYYERMFQDPLSAPYLAGSTPSYLIIGGIPLGLRGQLVQDRVALVGDAAGMAKPTSGGGIYYGLVASEHLARVAHRGLLSDRLGEGDLRPYERRVRATIDRELRKGWRLRALYKRLRDEDFNRLSRLLSAPEAKAVIERVGDIDYPSRLVLPLLWAQPRLGPFFLRVLLRPSPT